jgi:glycosyltransferase involved in cell wall biosynthesis
VRVMSVISTLDPARGGTQSGAAGMIIASQRRGVSNTVVAAARASAPEASAGLVGRLRAEGVTVVEFPTVASSWERAERWGLSPRKVRWLNREAGAFDAVNIHGVWGLGLVAALRAARRNEIPAVVTAHESLTSFDIDNSRSHLRRRQKLLLKRFFLSRARLFVVCSELEAASSLPDADRERLRVIPYAVVDDAKPPHQIGRPRPSDGLRLGYVGRIDAKKNVGLLLEAVAALPPHVRLEVAGDGIGELPGRLRDRADELGITDRVEWLGFIDADARSELLQRIDLLVMPSQFESFGMAAAEAMTQGVPVLVSRRTGIAEIIARHGGGVVVDPSVDALAAAIAELDSDRESLIRLGTDGARAARAELGMDRVGGLLAEMYEEVAAGAA